MSTLKAHSRIVEEFNYKQLILKQPRLFTYKSEVTSTQKITPSTGKRRHLSAGNLIGQYSGSRRPSKSDRKAEMWTETRW